MIFQTDLLIRVFIALLVSWVIMVTPHVVFQDYVQRGNWYSFGTLMYVQSQVTFYESNYETVEVRSILSYRLKTMTKETSTSMLLSVLFTLGVNVFECCSQYTTQLSINCSSKRMVKEDRWLCEFAHNIPTNLNNLLQISKKFENIFDF